MGNDPRKGMDLDAVRGNDPTGVDPHATHTASGNDQQSPPGAEGREGGAAGKRTRVFDEAAREEDPSKREPGS